MSRAINVNATEAEIEQLCSDNGAVISASEVLLSGGVRVVLTSPQGAATMRRIFGSRVIDSQVRRAPMQLPRNR